MASKGLSSNLVGSEPNLYTVFSSLLYTIGRVECSVKEAQGSISSGTDVSMKDRSVVISTPLDPCSGSQLRALCR